MVSDSSPPPRLSRFQPDREPRSFRLPGSRRTRWIAGVLTLILVIVGIGLSVPKSWYSQDALNRQQGLGRYAGTLTAEQRLQVARLVPRLENFVAIDRGRAFPRAVTVRYLPDHAFVKTLAGGIDFARGAGPAARALGLSSQPGEVSRAVQKINRSDTVALYVSSGNVVYVRGNDLGVENADILVHELTHAWDDARFDLARVGAPAHGADQTNAVTALVEGDATTVQGAYLDSIGVTLGCQVMEELEIPFDPPCRALHYTDDINEINPGDIDAALEAYGQFPYTAGTIFVRQLLAHGGTARVDAAFRRPPVDTAQVIEPRLYLDDVHPRHVSAPVIAHRLGRSASLGELGETVILTGGALDTGVRGYLAGWAGDRYVEDREQGRRCLHDRLELRSAHYATAAMARFRTWARKAAGRTAQREGPTSLEFSSCQ